MKKKLLCIIVAVFLFFCVPVKGYAASLAPLTFGMSEEVVLAFLASLLGVSAREAINSYTDLTEYANDLRLGFTEYIAGSATSLEIAKWIQAVAVGNIDKSSVIWEKFYQYCMEQYRTVTDGLIIIPANNPLSVSSIGYTLSDRAGFSYANGAVSNYINDIKYASSYYYTYGNNNNSTHISLLGATDIAVSGFSSYTYDNKTVYYNSISSGGSFGNTLVIYPTPILDQTLSNEIVGSNKAKYAWTMVYGGYTAPSANVGVISGAMDNVLTSSVVDGLIDGSSVLQLYNPAASQNGLQIVPDPEDPDDIVVPAMLTADWYNFLKQFGPSGAAQFVAAYNALNAVQGVSTGAIDGIYNNLGIASAISPAAQAAQGTLTLADNNVFPQASTIADAVIGVIPGALTPEVPDNGIDNESDQGLYKLPDLKDFFPFCIPFDLIDLLSCFIAEPETPQFVIALSTGEDTVTGQMDLHIWDNIASVLRGLELMAFTVGLILITRNIIRG